jgi:hypothetical protein
MAARNGKAELAALEKAHASLATPSDLQARDGQSKERDLNEIPSRRNGSATV